MAPLRLRSPGVVKIPDIFLCLIVFAAIVILPLAYAYCFMFGVQPLVNILKSILQQLRDLCSHRVDRTPRPTISNHIHWPIFQQTPSPPDDTPLQPISPQTPAQHPAQPAAPAPSPPGPVTPPPYSPPRTPSPRPRTPRTSDEDPYQYLLPQDRFANLPQHGRRTLVPLIGAQQTSSALNDVLEHGEPPAYDSAPSSRPLRTSPRHSEHSLRSSSSVRSSRLDQSTQSARPTRTASQDVLGNSEPPARETLPRPLRRFPGHPEPSLRASFSGISEHASPAQQQAARTLNLPATPSLLPSALPRHSPPVDRQSRGSSGSEPSRPVATRRPQLDFGASVRGGPSTSPSSERVSLLPDHESVVRQNEMNWDGARPWAIGSRWRGGEGTIWRREEISGSAEEEEEEGEEEGERTRTPVYRL